MTADEKAEIIHLRTIGYTQKQVAVMRGVCERTIRRIDKEFADKGEDIDLEDDVFEDEEEQWVMRYTKALGASTPDSKSWNFIVYDDSAPKDWKERMAALGCELSYCLHDEDVWLRDSKDGKYKKGEEKKHHWHGNLKGPKKISLKKACMIIQQITHGPVPKPCVDEVGLVMYYQHRHKDGTPMEGKQLYDADRIVFVNGWEPERSEKDLKRMIGQLEEYLIGLTKNYSMAIKLVSSNLGPEYTAILRQHSYHFKAIVDANRFLTPTEQEMLDRLTKEEAMLDAEAEQHWRQQQLNLDSAEQEEIIV